MAFDSMEALEWLRKHLEPDSPDLLREMVRSFAEHGRRPRPTRSAGPAMASAARSGSTR